MSNKRRQALTFGQYLADHHYSSSGAYTDFAGKTLQKKLERTLGKSMQKGQVVDWELDGVRTSPIDHLNKDQSPTDLMQSIVDGSEVTQPEDEQVKLVDEELGSLDSKSLRDHLHVRLLREAKELTRLQSDMEQYRNYYENMLLKAMMNEGNTEEHE